MDDSGSRPDHCTGWCLAARIAMTWTAPASAKTAIAPAPCNAPTHVLPFAKAIWIAPTTGSASESPERAPVAAPGRDPDQEGQDLKHEHDVADRLVGGERTGSGAEDVCGDQTPWTTTRDADRRCEAGLQPQCTCTHSKRPRYVGGPQDQAARRPPRSIGRPWAGRAAPVARETDPRRVCR